MRRRGFMGLMALLFLTGTLGAFLPGQTQGGTGTNAPLPLRTPQKKAAIAPKGKKAATPKVGSVSRPAAAKQAAPAKAQVPKDDQDKLDAGVFTPVSVEADPPVVDPTEPPPGFRTLARRPPSETVLTIEFIHENPPTPPAPPHKPVTFHLHIHRLKAEMGKTMKVEEVKDASEIWEFLDTSAGVWKPWPADGLEIQVGTSFTRSVNVRAKKGKGKRNTYLFVVKENGKVDGDVAVSVKASVLVR